MENKYFFASEDEGFVVFKTLKEAKEFGLKILKESQSGLTDDEITEEVSDAFIGEITHFAEAKKSKNGTSFSFVEIGNCLIENYNSEKGG